MGGGSGGFLLFLRIEVAEQVGTIAQVGGEHLAVGATDGQLAKQFFIALYAVLLQVELRRQIEVGVLLLHLVEPLLGDGLRGVGDKILYVRENVHVMMQCVLPVAESGVENEVF